MGFGVYLRSDSPEAEMERRIHVQVMCLGHVPTKTVEEAGRDWEKSKQEMVSQPDLPWHLEGGLYISLSYSRKLGFCVPALVAPGLRATKEGKRQALCTMGKASPGGLM